MSHWICDWDDRVWSVGRILLLSMALLCGAAVLGPVVGGAGLSSIALADDDDGDGDDDGGGTGGGGGGGDDGGPAAAPDLSRDGTGGDDFSADDQCFEEALLLPPWLRRCGRPRDVVPARPRGSVRAAVPGAAPPRLNAVEPPNAIPREIIVYRASPAQIAALQGRGFVVIARATVAGHALLRLRVPDGETTAGGLRLARQVAPDAIVDFNHVYRPAQASCDTPVCRQRRAIKWPEPPDECRVAAVMAMIDTTIDLTVPALQGQQIEVINGVSKGRALASSSHATAIASLLVGRNDAAVPGLLPRSRVIAIQAFHRSSSGEDIADTFDIAAALDTASRRGARVVNMSLTGPNNKVLADSVRETIAGDTVVIAAAGNLGPTGPVVYPAGYEAVIAVTAVGDDLRVYRGANRGSFIDFAAPGVNVQVVSAKVATRFESGTSFAAPFVTAALAAARSRNGAASTTDLVAALRLQVTDLGRPGRDPVFGWGLVQVQDICR
ncbi:MAG: S8 family serine peptidase [Hyphomicrobiaceae bacterium]|nr:S8 family serine peptidase [Hyphomicrobiaceae bacterium]